MESVNEGTSNSVSEVWANEGSSKFEGHRKRRGSKDKAIRIRVTFGDDWGSNSTK